MLTLGFARIEQEITRHGAFEQVIPINHVQRLLATLRNALVTWTADQCLARKREAIGADVWSY